MRMAWRCLDQRRRPLIRAAFSLYLLETCCLFQQGGLVRAFPGELDVIPAKVTVGGRLAVDRAAQVQVADDGAGAQVKVLD